jgi:hypothetical protein
MEKKNLNKHSFSISSLKDKTESVSYALEESGKKNGSEYYIKEINKLLPEINYLCGKNFLYKIILILYSEQKQ